MMEGDSTFVGTWYWIMRWVIGALTVIGNGLVIFLIMGRRRLQVTANLYILSLAVADFSVGLFVIPCTYACTFMFQCNWSLAMAFYNLLFYVSVGNLCLMTVDRYAAIVHPFRYAACYSSPSKVACFIFLAWILPALLSVVPFVWMKASASVQHEAEKDFGVIRVLVFEIIPCTAMVIIYARIFQIVRRHTREIVDQRTRALTALSNTSALRAESGLPLNLTRHKDSSSAKATAVVVAFFVFCWVISAGRAICVYGFDSCVVPTSVTLASRLLMLSNSAVNPVIYALIKKDIRAEMKHLIRDMQQTFQ